jgi:hypothetical protein
MSNILGRVLEGAGSPKEEPKPIQPQETAHYWYRDQEGDLWRATANGRVILYINHRENRSGAAGLAEKEAMFGPLTPCEGPYYVLGGDYASPEPPSDIEVLERKTGHDHLGRFFCRYPQGGWIWEHNHKKLTHRRGENWLDWKKEQLLFPIK